MQLYSLGIRYQVDLTLYISSYPLVYQTHRCRFKVIIARSDSAQVLGMEEAVTRLKLASDAGADVCFIEGVRTSELLESTVAALAPKPVSSNLTCSISVFLTD
jgi:2-methylisocitrate lyase-like PEP mutase family enzyme